jgi:serine O-acetyltransferase
MYMRPPDSLISASMADWSREASLDGRWAPAKFLLAAIRDWQRHQQNTGLLAKALQNVAVLRYRIWSAVTGADIPLNCQIGGGLLLPHPNGVVIHPRAHIGVNCLIFQQVTIGVIDDQPPPFIGGHVDIGAGAKILGNIKVGDHAKIGANAVVLCDVPEGATAVGIPAKIIRA